MTPGQEAKPLIEHVAFNVVDPTAIARWYAANIGMKIVRKAHSPENTHFIADASGRMVLEIYRNDAAPIPPYAALSHMSMHLAFMAVDLAAMRDKLVSVGADVAEDVTVTPAGDQVLMMRDPWGLAIQFVNRVEPMLKPSELGFEHFALNAINAEKTTDWYVKNLGMTVVRKGGAPTNTNFISGAGNNVMMEMYNNAGFPVLDLAATNHLSLHFAYTVEDVRRTRDELIKQGAGMVEDIREAKSGDQVVTLRDPRGLPIQFIKRREPLLR